MENPFESLHKRLDDIESSLSEIKELLKKQKITDEKDEIITVTKAAELLNLSIPTIYSKVSKGDLPFMKRSKRLYFSRDDLFNYLKQGRKKSNSEIEAEAKHYLNRKIQ
jgi:excisionase family DNA binding protein